MNMRIEKLNKKNYVAFTEMFCDYFINDLKENLTRDFIEDKIINSQIFKHYENDVIFINMMYCNNVAKGFIIYQIDTIRSDWNERPGCGFIREFYIKDDYRRRGMGTLLLSSCEKHLKSLGVQSIYLTCDENDYVKNFYTKNNYINEKERNSYNKHEYFSKKL